MQRKDVLGEIDSQSDNSHGLPLSNELMRHSHFPSWHFVAGCRNTRLVRDGEVPFIRYASAGSVPAPAKFAVLQAGLALPKP
jgi:hypothetical protein